MAGRRVVAERVLKLGPDWRLEVAPGRNEIEEVRAVRVRGQAGRGSPGCI